MDLKGLFLLQSHFQKRTATLRYLEYGQGPALIILPSPLIMATSYRHLAMELSKNFRVYVPELPGSGLSTIGNQAFDTAQLTASVIEFLYDCKIDRALLLGHSNSGPIAMATAVHAPKKIKGLILADSIGLESRSPLQVLTSGLWDGFLEIRFTFWAFPHFLYNLLNHTRNFFHQILLSFRAGLTEFLSLNDVETLIAWGERDHTMPFSQALRLQKILPYASLISSKEGSHNWILTDPKAFSEAIVQWAFPAMKKGYLYAVPSPAPFEKSARSDS